MKTFKGKLFRAVFFIVPQIVFLFSVAPVPLLSYGFYPITPSTSESSSSEPAPQESNKATEPVSSSQPRTAQGRHNTRWTLEFRGAAFLPLKDGLTKIYGTALPTLELEGSCCLTNIRKEKNRLVLWGNASWTNKVGDSHHSKDFSRLNLVPFSLGLNYEARISSVFDFYLGAGPAFSLLWLKNYNGLKTTHISREAFGVRSKTGFHITFHRCFFIDLFADYYYTPFGKMKAAFRTLDGNFSAFIVGGGVGGKF